MGMERSMVTSMEPQVGHCWICLEARLCRAVDMESRRPVCRECVVFVIEADRVLWIASRRAFGICRPVAGTMLDK